MGLLLVLPPRLLQVVDEPDKSTVTHISRTYTYLEWNSDRTLTATASISTCLESLPTLTLLICRSPRVTSFSGFTRGMLWTMRART